jgi:uncharacterized membrane protein
MAWSEFALAFVVFFLSHSLPVRPPLRPILVGALGPRSFTLAYSALSVGVLTWLIVAAARAPFVPLWPWAPWQSGVALIVMLAACVLLAVSIGRPNPFSFGGGRNHLFDPKHPGVVRLKRHPLLVVLALWSGAHLLANGDLAHAILFGTFGAFSVLGGRLIDRRRQREMGGEWARLWHAVRATSGRAAFRPTGPTASRALVGLILYLSLITLHPVVIGVSPL